MPLHLAGAGAAGREDIQRALAGACCWLRNAPSRAVVRRHVRSEPHMAEQGGNLPFIEGLLGPGTTRADSRVGG